MTAPAWTESAFARTVLFGMTLAEKLAHPEIVVADAEPDEPLGDVTFPGRPPGLRPGDGIQRPFPKREALVDPQARGWVLHHFANHELLALELMALALLRFPGAPAPFRQGLVRTMAEEQTHLRLYLDRMAELGVTFGELALSDFFWNALKGMATPFAFVTGMSLTFEQANLDFSRLYRDLFAAVGDQATADILERVYREEIGHVKHGLAWFERWRPPGEDAWTAYVASLRLPLSPSRAKSQPYDREGRRAAGLPEDFIRRLDVFGGSKGRPPAVFWFNSDVEMEVAHACDAEAARTGGDGYNPAQRHVAMMAESDALLAFLAQEGDVVLCRAAPSLALLEEWRSFGVSLPEFREGSGPEQSLRDMRGERRVLGPLQPWGWGPRALRWAAALQGLPYDDAAVRRGLTGLYAKTGLPALRAAVRQADPALAKALGPGWMDGRVVADWGELAAFCEEVRKALGTPVLVKAPFSAAGRERVRIDGSDRVTDAQMAWLGKAWRKWGPLLAEPFVTIVADGSLLGELNPVGGRLDLAPSLFHCDERGQYRGHRLLPRGFASFPAEVRSVLVERDGGVALTESLQGAARGVFAHLAGLGYGGRAGIDFHMYRLPGEDRLRVQAIGEVNARTTMGHVALALARHILPGRSGLWVTLRSQELRAAEGVDFARWAASLRQVAPLQVVRRERPFIAAGVTFTNDPQHARFALGVMAVGEEAVALLERHSGLPPWAGAGA